MAVLAAAGDPPPPEALAAAEAALVRGEVIVIPTDTVYGVAVDAGRPGATDRLFALKRRPRDVPLAVLVADPDQAADVADAGALPAAAPGLMRAFWPGGLTLVLPRSPALRLDLGAAGDTVGVRCPAHPVPLALAARVGPIAATSANRHGLDTPATAAGVVEQLKLGGEDVVLDAGPCHGVPSTVIDVCGPEPRLLREGAVPWGEVLAVLGRSRP